jgi:hypothetical protein
VHRLDDRVANQIGAVDPHCFVDGADGFAEDLSASPGEVTGSMIRTRLFCEVSHYAHLPYWSILLTTAASRVAAP